MLGWLQKFVELFVDTPWDYKEASGNVKTFKQHSFFLFILESKRRDPQS